MKSKRIVVKGQGVYHVFNRTAYSRYTLNENEREMFVKMMRKQAGFCGIEVLSYCILSNHYHMLVRVPDDRSINDRELLTRYRFLYSDDPAPKAAMRPSDLEAVLKENGEPASQIRLQLCQRMHRLSVFMKELQQRFGIWYNATHGNKGTLWSERFRSVLVEHNPQIMQIIAAYIELNPIRAGMVNRTESYRWCSFSAALAGDPAAQAGIRAVIGHGRDYARALLIYTRNIYADTDLTKSSETITDSPSEAAASRRTGLQEQREPMSLLRRVRAFTHGVLIGTAGFVCEFHRNRAHLFGLKARENGPAHPILAGSDSKIYALREDRKS